jgi:glucose-6-phosphate 1-dehydrogenase
MSKVRFEQQNDGRAGAGMVISDALVIFGGSGDLAIRMLFPSLYHLEAEGLLPRRFAIVACGRTPRTRDVFVESVRAAILRTEPGRAIDEAAWSRFAPRLDYCTADATLPAGAAELAERLKRFSATAPLFYMSTSPSVFGAVGSALKSASLAGQTARVVLEKPIGHDLASSRIINDAIGDTFSERSIFRVDHYLGKETVQNLLALRFANTLFEPVWNNQAIDHVQITVAETDGVGDRWRYYDEYGAIRDMLQNHILQLLCLIAMEPPSDLTPDAVRDEKVKVLRALRPINGEALLHDAIRGQYASGSVEGQACAAYVDEKGAPSGTETFVALRVDIDNWRWAGVPFFIRTGKRLPSRRTQIVVQFKPVRHSIFPGVTRDRLPANRLVIDLQPDEDIRLLLMNKEPGLEGMSLQPLPLSLKHSDAQGKAPRRRIAYERLLLDAIRGSSTLFVRRDEIEAAWRWVSRR